MYSVRKSAPESMSNQICEYSKHRPMRVHRGHKASVWICEICGHKLKLEKKPVLQGTEYSKSIGQGELFPE